MMALCSVAVVWLWPWAYLGYWRKPWLPSSPGGKKIQATRGGLQNHQPMELSPLCCASCTDTEMTVCQPKIWKLIKILLQLLLITIVLTKRLLYGIKIHSNLNSWLENIFIHYENYTLYSHFKIFTVLIKMMLKSK